MKHTVQVNRVEVTIEEGEPNIEAIARSVGGAGWGVPLNDMTPNDLRELANIMESLGCESDGYMSDERRRRYIRSGTL